MRSKYLICFIFILLFSSCIQEESEDFLTGKELYIIRCGACHGDELEGKLGPMLGKDSPAKEMPDLYWVQTITVGKGSMPGQNLTDEEVSLIMEYIREVQK